STEEDAMDDQVKDKGKGRELGNIGEGGESGNESVDEVELKGEDGLKSQSDGEVEGEDEGGDEGGDDGEDEGEDDGENSDKEKDKESDEDMGKVEDAGNVKGASVDQDVDMVDINKVETQVATAAMANTIEVTTSEEMAVTLEDLQGASKTIGGFARGNAVGNTYGFGDEPMVDLPALQQKGKVMVYISSSDPSTILPTETPPSFQKMMVVTHMSKPLFDTLGKKWPTIKNPEYTIFVHDIVWTLLGSFEEITSVEGDEEITWHTENNKPVPQILLSNFTLPSHLSTAVAASAVLPTAATTSLIVPVASASVQPQGGRVHFTQEQTAMADALEIPVALRHTGNALKLQEHYTRYLALLEAEKRLKKMQKDGTWPAGLRLPVGRDIPNLFIGKSTWHDFWSKTFPHVAEYPEMVKWLSNEEDCMETEELFGVKLKAYHFAELLAWVQNGGSLVKPKKGAAKEGSAATSSTSKKSSASKKPAGSAKKVAASKSGTSKRKYSQLALLLWMTFLIPHVLASPQSAPFPDIGFQEFRDFIINNFGNKISLPTVTMMLLSMTNNTELLSLHFKQNPGSKATSWIKCLARAIIEQLGDNNADTLFSEYELSMFKNATARESNVSSLAVKLGEFSHLLGFYPFNNKQKFTDHERTASTVNTETMQLYLNSALYIKVGQKLWVDRKFSTSVMNGIYHLHASTSSWANYFNDTYGTDCITLSRRQVWAAFVQESIQQASEISKLDFIARDIASIEEVTEEAFAALGNDGLIQPAKGHACAECSQPYRATSDVVVNPNNDPSTSAQSSVQMQNVTMRVIDGMVNGTKVNIQYDL
ncbi:hypothetical protein K443DRAFT_113196, partial [Laccaria amethystina LaAM-08-1]